MPELPEVEVTRQSFATRIEGAQVTGVHLGKPLRWPLGCSTESLLGCKVGQVIRRGKYLWLPLHSPCAGGSGGLLIHLGMSGSLAFGPETPPGRHDHFSLTTSHGLLRLTDPRRFGAVLWSASLEVDPAAKLLGRLGLEPFDSRFNGAYFYQALRGRRQAIKQVLLGGDIVVGAGNIYACEALFAAKINPRLPAEKISQVRAAQLVLAIRDILAQAVALGGASLRNFRSAHGTPGAFQLAAKVYGREGKPCDACGKKVSRIVQGQRSTFFCHHCQKR
ncbi:MAG: bifunctional DNA-formamidopyrimidine glycosylase/DNA-(apurinic or apyrimidinic site) lyase [Burkholderiales bacterium]|jgi:formamidopyrimidine-DNA glycosylase